MIINNMHNVTITSSSYNPDANTSITITATCKDFNGNAVAGKSLTIKKNGTNLYTGTTNSNGQISTTTTCGVCGAVNFSVDSWNCVVNVNPYPIGAIYTSVDNTSPATLFGGTWTQLTDAFLYASTTADDNITTPPNDGTRGEATHSLTESEMPRHTHIQNAHNHTQVKHSHTFYHYQNNGSTTTYSASWANQKSATQATSEATPTINDKIATNKYTGGTGDAQSASNGVAHNNMPPYIKVYMWKRTA